jgi:hypothetical protein
VTLQDRDHPARFTPDEVVEVLRHSPIVSP